MKGVHKVEEVKIMLGNEAIARGAYEAGVKVSAAYLPKSPYIDLIAKFILANLQVVGFFSCP